MTAVASRTFSTARTRGSSDAAQFLSAENSRITRKLHESITLGLLGSGVLYDLDNVYRECQERGWDGNDSAPVGQLTYENACLLLESLPFGMQPAVAADPDGNITLEWYRSPRRSLLLSIDSNANIHYAALLGTNRTYGTEHFYGVTPNRIVALIGETMEV